MKSDQIDHQIFSSNGDGRKDGTHRERVPLARTNELDSALERATRQGDFRPIESLLEVMSDSERYKALWKVLRTSQSRLGKRHDFEEEIRLIGRFGGAKANILLKKTCENIVPGFDLEAEIGFVRGFDDRLWNVFLQSLADDNPRKALSLGEMNIAESSRLDVYSVATSAWLKQDSVAASTYVAELPEGSARDIAVGAMVDWLLSIHDTESASHWVNEVGNVALKQTLSNQVIAATNR
ncbi:MAG: hypothetical protein WCK77_20920 [Verrucomicrobiota bacterium]